MLFASKSSRKGRKFLLFYVAQPFKTVPYETFCSILARSLWHFVQFVSFKTASYTDGSLPKARVREDNDWFSYVAQLAVRCSYITMQSKRKKTNVRRACRSQQTGSLVSGPAVIHELPPRYINLRNVLLRWYLLFRIIFEKSLRTILFCSKNMSRNTARSHHFVFRIS